MISKDDRGNARKCSINGLNRKSYHSENVIPQRIDTLLNELKNVCIWCQILTDCLIPAAVVWCFSLPSIMVIKMIYKWLKEICYMYLTNCPICAWYTNLITSSPNRTTCFSAVFKRGENACVVPRHQTNHCKDNPITLPPNCGDPRKYFMS